MLLLHFSPTSFEESPMYSHTRFPLRYLNGYHFLSDKRRLHSLSQMKYAAKHSLNRYERTTVAITKIIRRNKLILCDQLCETQKCIFSISSKIIDAEQDHTRHLKILSTFYDPMYVVLLYLPYPNLAQPHHFPSSV